jgi:hypothetical protein
LGRLVNLEIGGFLNNLSFDLIKKSFKKFFIYLCGVDLDKFLFFSKNTFIVFQGFFFSNKLIKHINLVIPITIYTEQTSFFVI